MDGAQKGLTIDVAIDLPPMQHNLRLPLCVPPCELWIYRFLQGITGTLTVVQSQYITILWLWNVKKCVSSVFCADILRVRMLIPINQNVETILDFQ